MDCFKYYSYNSLTLNSPILNTARLWTCFLSLMPTFEGTVLLRCQHNGSLRQLISIFYTEATIFHSSNFSIIHTRRSGLRSGTIASKKISLPRELKPVRLELQPGTLATRPQSLTSPNSGRCSVGIIHLRTKSDLILWLLLFSSAMYSAHGPLLWSSCQSSWLLTQRFRVRFSTLPNFLLSSGSGTGSTQPREVKWGVTWKKI
jgi:hypothetical protein